MSSFAFGSRVVSKNFSDTWVWELFQDVNTSFFLYFNAMRELPNRIMYLMKNEQNKRAGQHLCFAHRNNYKILWIYWPMFIAFREISTFRYISLPSFIHSSQWICVVFFFFLGRGNSSFLVVNGNVIKSYFIDWFLLLVLFHIWYNFSPFYCHFRTFFIRPIYWLLFHFALM